MFLNQVKQCTSGCFVQSSWNVLGMQESLKPVPVANAAQLLCGCESCAQFSMCGQISYSWDELKTNETLIYIF